MYTMSRFKVIKLKYYPWEFIVIGGRNVKSPPDPYGESL